MWTRCLSLNKTCQYPHWSAICLLSIIWLAVIFLFPSNWFNVTNVTPRLNDIIAVSWTLTMVLFSESSDRKQCFEPLAFNVNISRIFYALVCRTSHKGICMGDVWLHPALNGTTLDFIQQCVWWHYHPGMWEPHEKTAIVPDGAPGPVKQPLIPWLVNNHLQH